MSLSVSKVLQKNVARQKQTTCDRWEFCDLFCAAWSFSEISALKSFSWLYSTKLKSLLHHKFNNLSTLVQAKKRPDSRNCTRITMTCNDKKQKSNRFFFLDDVLFLENIIRAINYWPVIISSKIRLHRIHFLPRGWNRPRTKNTKNAKTKTFIRLSWSTRFTFFGQSRRRATFNVGMEIEKRLASYAKQAIVGSNQRHCHRMVNVTVKKGKQLFKELVWVNLTC